MAPTTTPADRPKHQLNISPANVRDLPRLLKNAPPGTVVQLAPGTYKEVIPLDGVHGITLRGGPGVVFDIGTPPPAPGTLSIADPDFGVRKTFEERYPSFDVDGLIAIRNSSDVRIENVTIRNMWPNGISINDSQNTTIHGLECVGCTNAIWAAGTSTKGITVEHSTWDQDPTGSIWKNLDWKQVHDGAFASYNGALLQARDIGGDVVVRDNDVRNAFNAVRIRTTTPELGKNVSITGNTFTNIADNVMEPEELANNWTFSGNTMHGVHAPISLDDVAGGPVTITHNIFGSLVMPRASLSPDDVTDEPHRGVKFFKLRGEKPSHLQGLVIQDNTFIIGRFKTRMSDAPFPPGSVVTPNRYVDLWHMLQR